ncbi:histone deacetylase family protein [Sphingobacterium cellulitidis]|nr:histone deacetylase [Sphingobacterium soli]MBA8985996.1 acetoin utilization deacetylase AcuC-like enzyme [Sphingobacterium soli]
MLKIAHHTAYIQPLPEGHRFPMMKYELIPEQLIYEGLVSKDSFFEPELVDKEIIYLAHDKQYTDDLLNLRLDPKMIRRIGFPMTQSLVDRERYLIDGSIKASLEAIKTGVSFNTAGGTHHAGRDFGEGFCLLNDQAVAAAYLYHSGLAKKILIIDLDVHQGNGTAHIFEGHPDIITFSIHGEKNFPFKKEKSHIDIPLADGVEDEEYLSLLNETLPRLFQENEPDFVYFQSGVDVLATDKLGKFKLTMAGCQKRDELVFQNCKNFNVPVEVSMGGGYSYHIKDIVNAHVNTYRTAIDIYDL